MIGWRHSLKWPTIHIRVHLSVQQHQEDCTRKREDTQVMCSVISMFAVICDVATVVHQADVVKRPCICGNHVPLCLTLQMCKYALDHACTRVSKSAI